MTDKIIVTIMKVVNAILRGIANALETAAGSASKGYNDGYRKMLKESERIENNRRRIND